MAAGRQRCTEAGPSITPDFCALVLLCTISLMSIVAYRNRGTNYGRMFANAAARIAGAYARRAASNAGTRIGAAARRTFDEWIGSGQKVGPIGLKKTRTVRPSGLKYVPRRFRSRRRFKRYKRRSPLLVKRRSMRRFNKGPMQLAKCLSTGTSLPQTSFARLSAVNISRPLPVRDGGYLDFCPMDTDIFGQGVRYQGIWSTLYKEFAVLGAKTIIKITPEVFPDRRTTVLPNGAMGNHGFWYIRVYSAATSKRPQVGYPMTSGGDIVDMANIWKDEADFLGDKTVTFVKDPFDFKLTQWFSVMGAPTTNATIAPDFFVEMQKRIRTLMYKFSYKKFFQTTDVLNEVTFTEWDTSPANGMLCRLGFVSFANDGVSSYRYFRYPVPFLFTAHFEHLTTVAVREPIDLHDAESTAALSAKFMRESAVPIAMEEADELEG